MIIEFSRKEQKLNPKICKEVFTLIELLVVIAIIGILAAMLLPALQSARQQAYLARWIVYKSNLRVDPRVVALYDFQEGNGTTLGNLATSPEGNHNYKPEDHNGTLSTIPPIWTTGRWSGKKALYFNGTNNNIDCGNYNAGGQKGFTILAWFKAYTWGVSDARIISKSTSSNEADHWFMLSTINSGGMRIRFRLKTDNGGTTTLIAGSGDLELNKWTHAACVYDGANIYLYKDGELVGSVAKTGVVENNNSIPVFIGDNPDGTKKFAGLIDEVVVFQAGITPQEVMNHYKAGKPK